MYPLAEKRLEMAKLPDIVGLVDARLVLEPSDVIWVNSWYDAGHLAPNVRLDSVLPLEAEYSVALRDIVLEAPSMCGAMVVMGWKMQVRIVNKVRCQLA